MQMTKLNDGVAIPQIGFGTFQIPAGAETEKAVAFALSRGCRHIDTAAAYFNEADVGNAVRASGVLKCGLERHDGAGTGKQTKVESLHWSRGQALDDTAASSPSHR